MARCGTECGEQDASTAGELEERKGRSAGDVRSVSTAGTEESARSAGDHRSVSSTSTSREPPARSAGGLSCARSRSTSAAQ
eukprot:3216538-Rhodomonas_salina.1